MNFNLRKSHGPSASLGGESTKRLATDWPEAIRTLISKKLKKCKLLQIYTSKTFWHRVACTSKCTHLSVN